MKNVLGADINPCLSCGACCAYFRTVFYWREAGNGTAASVPEDMTEDVNQFLRAMKGTSEKNPHCVALQGKIGESVFCSIYDIRPSVCRNFPPSFLDGKQNLNCDRARTAHGLAPLPANIWDEKDGKEHQMSSHPNSDTAHTNQLCRFSLIMMKQATENADGFNFTDFSVEL